jgi:hypothetical protein
MRKPALAFRTARKWRTCAVGIMKAGFALQIAAQLPIIATLIRAHANLGLSCPVIHCSFSGS